MQKIKTIQTFSDPSHGWGKVSKKELQKLNLLEKISHCSYQTKDFVFLEEDCDLTIYVNALKEKGIEYKFRGTSSNKRSRIRNYDNFYI